jgi:hypothetical protein
MVFNEVNPGLWSAEKEGDSITGIFLSSEKEVGPSKSMLYHLESDGKAISIWGSMILDQKMSYIQPGQTIRITFMGLGEKKVGKNAPKIFKVEVDK